LLIKALNSPFVCASDALQSLTASESEQSFVYLIDTLAEIIDADDTQLGAQ